jgi:3-deoxy-D-manno-octulosonate 8-phosphate phosphatase (KDO 8-P phosphatase)
MRHLLQTGIEVAIITACKSITIKRRMEDLGVTHVYQAQSDKRIAYEDLKQKLHLTNEQIAYAGDDLPDIPILSQVGLAITVAGAPSVMQQYVHWTTTKKGGKGAAREICDFIMQAQGTYQAILNSYLSR